jgi:Tol biopolymer transport system component
MGEVFTARDTRLDRLVAVKVLPRELASDPDRRARFEREARAISAFSHPHVCALFDVGRVDGPSGGIDYLVMERLEGETLAARLARGPLPVPEAVAIGSQLAEALAAAHRRGIVHRDVKPANVMLTRAGAKLLDFGLAYDGDREPRRAEAAVEAQSLATEAKPLTRVGTLVGTWPYLAPERVRGGAADARSDVFALGCVLHEALTGKRAFDGKTPSDISAAILGKEPADVRETTPGAPPALALLVQQCLAKDPDARWQCADDVARGLRLADVASRRATERAQPAASRWRWPLAAGALAAAAATAVVASVARREAPLRPLRFAVLPQPGTLFSRPTAGTSFAVSPDGQRIAFSAFSGGTSNLWLWSAQEGQAQKLEDTTGATSPFFSPDGGELAFFAGDDLRRVPCGGGPATTIATAAGASSGSWGRAGTILVVKPVGPDAGIYSVPASGGQLRAVSTAKSPRERRAFPRFLPDGRHYLLMVGYGLSVEERRLCVASIDGGEPECFASCHSQAEYSGSGHVLCVRGGTLVALPFDSRSRKPAGEAVPAAREVRWFGPSGAASFAVSADGSTLAYEPRPAPSRLAWVDRSGHLIAALGEPEAYGLLQLAPDGRHVAVDVVQPDGRGRELWSVDTGTGVANRLTFGKLDAVGPTWSPDGARLAYSGATDGPPDVTLLELDGSAREQVLLEQPGIQLTKHWSPDGRSIAYEDYAAGRRDQRQLWLLSLDGATRRVTSTPASSHSGRFSPDGRRLAYVSEETGRPEVYVASLAGGPPRRVSRVGGLLPRWRGDGRELFFVQPEGLVMAASAEGDHTDPRSLFHLEGATSLDFDYDVARDGQRFLVRLTSEPEGAGGLRVALEWSERLAAAAGKR